MGRTQLETTIEKLNYANASELRPLESKFNRFYRDLTRGCTACLALFIFLLLFVTTKGDGGTIKACVRCAAEEHVDRFYFLGMGIPNGTRTVQSDLTKCLLPHMGGRCRHHWLLVSDWSPFERGCGGGGSIISANHQFSMLPAFPELLDRKLAKDPKLLERIQQALPGDLFDLPELKALELEALEMAKTSSEYYE